MKKAFIIAFLFCYNFAFSQTYTLRDSVIASSDDTHERADATSYVTGTGILIGYNVGVGVRWGGTRFTNVNIPNGAIIDSASVAHYFLQDARPINTTIFAEAVDNAAAYNGSNGEISSRPRTTASVLWSATTVINTFSWSPNIASVIQEVINRPGWQSGNALNIIYQINPQQDPNPGGRSYDYNGVANSPKLYVEYRIVGSQQTRRRRLVQ